MSDRKITSVRLDPHVDSALEELDVSKSAVLRRLARQYVHDEDRFHDPLVEDIRKALEEAKEEHLDAVEDQYDDLLDRLPEPEPADEAVDRLNGEVEEVWESLTVFQFESLRKFETQIDPERSPREPDAEAVAVQANRLGIRPQQLSEELQKIDLEKGWNPPTSEEI